MERAFSLPKGGRVNGGKVFLNYRRDDSEGYVGRLYDHLSQRFPGRIFRDVTGLRPGEDFVNALDREGVSCKVLLAIIGKRWLSSADVAGRRRIDDPEDILRREIVHALQRNVLVIPVLVGGAVVPSIDDLPQELKPLGRRQALPISELDFERDLERLIEVLAQELCVAPSPGAHAVVPPPPPPATPRKHKRWPWILAGAVASLLLIAIVESVNTQNQSTPGASTTSTTSDGATPGPTAQQAGAPSGQPENPAPRSPAEGTANANSAAGSAAAAQWQRDLVTTLTAMNTSRMQMAGIFGSNPRSLPELQYQAKQLLGVLDTYDQQVDNFSDLLNQGQSDGYIVSASDRAQAAALQQVCDIRKQQSQKYRYESQLVLQYDPYSTPYATLMNELLSVQGEINALDGRAAGLLQQAGVQ